MRKGSIGVGGGRCKFHLAVQYQAFISIATVCIAASTLSPIVCTHVSKLLLIVIIERRRLSNVGSRNGSTRSTNIGGSRVGVVRHVASAGMSFSTHCELGEAERKCNEDAIPYPTAYLVCR